MTHTSSMKRSFNFWSCTIHVVIVIMTPCLVFLQGHRICFAVCFTLCDELVSSIFCRLSPRHIKLLHILSHEFVKSILRYYCVTGTKLRWLRNRDMQPCLLNNTKFTLPGFIFMLVQRWITSLQWKTMRLRCLQLFIYPLQTTLTAGVEVTMLFESFFPAFFLGGLL